MDENGTVTNPGAEAGQEAGSQNVNSEVSVQGSAFDFETTFAGLEPDNRDWLAKQGYNTADAVTRLGKQVYAQERLLGNAIRVPGKDATQEEREAFLNKLGRPEQPDAYEFAVPENLPENLPYDGERAAKFKAVAHGLGLTKDQAAKLHDWFVGETVGDFNSMGHQQAQALEQRAAAATEALVKAWGPLDGPTARANMELGNRLLDEAGGQPLVDRLVQLGVMTEDRVILDPVLAPLFANIGVALYREGEMLTGDPAHIGNPFADGSDNMTEQMRIAKADPELAARLIVAAGKKPNDFGLNL